MTGPSRQGQKAPAPRAECPVCGQEHERRLKSSPDARHACPYEGLEFAGLRAGHDRIYFGAWRKMDSSPAEIVRAYNQIGRHLKSIERVLEGEDLPAAKSDHAKAVEAYHWGDPREDSGEAVRFMDNALSYAHRVIDDLLHEKGLPPHHPMDFAEWYDAVEIPFRDEW